MSSFRLIVTLIFVLTFTLIQGAPSSQELQLTQGELETPALSLQPLA